MGLEKAALERGTGEIGTAWVDEHGATAAQFMLDASKGDGPTAEMEILRGDLAGLLYEAARDRATFRFGDRIRHIEQSDGAASVTFVGGRTEDYDAVVVAEGVGSPTRELIFPRENEPRWMDMTIAFLTIPRVAADDRRWRWYNATRSRSVSLRPDSHGTTRAMLMVQKPPGGEHEWDVARQKNYLKELFKDAKWEAPRIIDAIDGADDFYFEVLRQVRMPRWSKQRIALVGDSAWCVTPLGGIGASLAIVGAYILAGELSRSEDVGAGFAAYETFMRPIVGDSQSIPKLVPRLMHPRTTLGVRILHGLLNIASRPRSQALAARFASRKRQDLELPVFEGAVAVP